MTNDLVNILMITYNHEKYIGQAIESIVEQQTNFDYSLIIGEDCSNDKTREIIKEYVLKYPYKIKVIFQSHNVGPNKNVEIVLAECKAKYLALCEGDDYWTDPRKLQKQVDFLERNKDFVICTHGTESINENNEKEGMWFEPPETKDFYTLKDYISYGRSFIATSSILTRNYTRKIHEWYNNSPAGDMALIMSMCLQEDGKIKRFNEIMSVHRNHNGGVYSGLSYLEKLIFSIETRIFLRTKLPQEYESAFKKGLKKIISEITNRMDKLSQSNKKLGYINSELVKTNLVKQNDPKKTLKERIIMN